jgi:C-terminal processing protease CtpA/Prc
VATLRCGHTYANPYNQSGFIKKILLSQPDKLPFGLVWIDKRLFITKNATGDPAFNRGAEILSINGVPIKEFADQLLPMVKGDGSNEAVRYEQLNVVGYDAYELFDIYFPLVVRPKEGSFDLKLRTVSGEIVMTKVKPITRKERIDVFQNKYDDLPKTIDETWSCRIINNRIAYLKLGTFTVWNFEMDWKKYLKEAFKKFEKENTTDLIIDIRGNEGGLDAVIEELQQYMLKKDCDYGAFEERIRYTYVDEELRPYLKTWDNGIYDFRGKVSQNSNGSYSFTSKKDQIMRFKRSNKAFEGNIYLFVNAANSSSTFYLTSITKTCGSAEIVGETTGGNQKGLNGGNIFFLRLPNSGIEIDIPVYGQFNDAAADGGIEPDVFIKRRPEDLKNSTDGQLDRLVELIENE